MRVSSDLPLQDLQAALQFLSDAVAVFDRDGRFALWSQAFQDLQGADIPIVVGLPFEDLLRRLLALGRIPAARGAETAWLAERLARFATGDGAHDIQLDDGRQCRVEDRALPGGGRIGIRTDITEPLQRERPFQLLFDGNPVPMLVVDQDTLALIAVNDAAVAFYGYSRDAMLGLTLTDIRPETKPGDIAAALGRMERNTVHGMRIAHRLADGSVRMVEVSARLLAYEGRPAVLAAIFDRTEQLRMEGEIRRARTFLTELVDRIPTPVFVKDIADDARFVVYNQAASTLFGLRREAVIGRSATEIFDAAHVPIFTEQDEIALRLGSWEAPTDERIEQPNGSVRLVRTRKVRLSVEPDAPPRYVVGVAEDVTEQRASAARIVHMAHHDLLTDLPNRALFQDRLAVALTRLDASRDGLTLLYLDLDGFKAVNDRWGHATGDALLQAVGQRLRDFVSSDDMAARFGGDEFALIQAAVQHMDDAERLAGRLVEAIGKPYAIAGRDLRVGASIGIAMAPRHGTDAETLLARADAAMYRAKREGRRTFRVAA